MIKDVGVRISIEFKKTIDILYPDTRSMRAKTEKLNQLLQEIVYVKNK